MFSFYKQVKATTEVTGFRRSLENLYAYYKFDCHFHNIIMTETLTVCRDLLIGVIGQLDKLKNDPISFQEHMMAKQEKLLKSKTVQLVSIQAAVKNELQNKTRQKLLRICWLHLERWS